MDLFIVSLASLGAGFVDAIVGGGGLILIPTLFAAFPTAHPATLLGTNKGAAIWGTGLSTWQFSRRVDLRWAALLPAAWAYSPVWSSICSAPRPWEASTCARSAAMKRLTLMSAA